MRPAQARATPAERGVTRRSASALLRPARGAATWRAAILALAGLMLLPGTSMAIDLGDASVLSRQGQRLELAIPFGSDPGERVSVTRFEVVSVEATDGGAAAPDPTRFTISRPERRNVVYLRSERPVDLERLRIVVAVSGIDGPGSAAAYDIVIPPPSFTPAANSRGHRPRRR